MAVFVVDPNAEAIFFCGFYRQLHAVEPHLGQIGGLKAGAGGQTKTAKPLVGHFADLANDLVFFDGAVPYPKWHEAVIGGRVDKILEIHKFRGMRLAVRDGLLSRRLGRGNAETGSLDASTRWT